MAARPQEAPPFSVPCSRRHFTLITMRLAPSSLPQPLESLTPSRRFPAFSTPSPSPPRARSQPLLSSLFSFHLHTIDSTNTIHARRSPCPTLRSVLWDKNSSAARISDWSMSLRRVYRTAASQLRLFCSSISPVWELCFVDRSRRSFLDWRKEAIFACYLG